MDALWLARMQFSLTAMFHFIFPPITMGFAFLLVIIETMRWKTGNDLDRRMSESGFLGLLLFGRKRISSFFRWLAALMVWSGIMLSASWILVANSWMQTPADFRIVEGRAELTDFWVAVFNPSTFPRFFHTTAAAWVCGSFLMVGISGWTILRNRPTDVARGSLKLGTPVAFVSVVLEQVPLTEPAPRDSIPQLA